MVDKERKSALFGSRISSIFNAYSNLEDDDKKSRSIKIDPSKKTPYTVEKASSSTTNNHLTPDYNKSNDISLHHRNSTDSSIFLTPMSSNTTTTNQRKPRRKPPPELVPESGLDVRSKESYSAESHSKDEKSPVQSATEEHTSPHIIQDLEDSSNIVDRNPPSPYYEVIENQEISMLTSDINNLLFPKNFDSKPISEDGNSFSFINDYTSKTELPENNANYPTSSAEIITDYEDSNSNSSYFKNSEGSARNSISAPYPIDSPISGTYGQDLTYDVFNTNTEESYNDSITSPTIARAMESSSSRSSETLSSTQNKSTASKNSDNSASLVPIESSSSLVINTSTFNGIAPATSSIFNSFRSPIKPSSTFQSDFTQSELNDSPALNKTTSKTAMHTKSKSISSVWSSPSFKNVNLAALKKRMDLKPGEGEPSNYVLMIRRNAGTAYNESGPGKWKLPTGILPIDKSAANANGKYMRLAGGISQGRTKKASGVDLKHGHLQRRLLATEVDGGDDIVFGTNSLLTGTTSSLHTATKSSGSSIVAPFSRTSSLRKSITGSSSLSTNTESPSNTSIRRESIASTSSSSGSISESNQKFGYYQHASYRYEEDYDDDDSLESNEKPTHTLRASNDDDEYSERGGFYLANPDSDDNEN